jgi:hypothetical protein
MSMEYQMGETIRVGNNCNTWFEGLKKRDGFVEINRWNYEKLCKDFKNNIEYEKSYKSNIEFDNDLIKISDDDKIDSKFRLAIIKCRPREGCNNFTRYIMGPISPWFIRHRRLMAFSKINLRDIKFIRTI